MSKTVDFGIDLGTTNSAVARMTRRGPEVIKDRYEQDVTPSAVGMNSVGAYVAGKDAYEKSDFQAIKGFKRDMGSNRAFEMRDGSEVTPVELSAEILKEIKAAVSMRYGQTLTHAVITVPAMFMQPQIDATHKAAELAGIEAVALLQEPIAAATAYLNDDPKEGKYLVYDLGGGTFDVSIVELRAGEMRVLGHGGDNYLGGSDIDEKLLDWLVAKLERQGVSPEDFTTGAKRGIAMQECERVKKLLSQQESAILDLSDLGGGVDGIPIERQVLIDLIEDDVDRTIDMVKVRLEESGLRAGDIRSILLVGGPTRIPYVRDCLTREFGIPLNCELDPMTVVAEGAAITASTIIVEDPAIRDGRATSGVVSLDLTYEPVVNERSCPLAGKVRENTFEISEVRISRGDDWDTGWIKLRNGAFITDLTLGSDSVTDFSITARTSNGSSVEVTPSSIAVRSGIAPAQGVAPYNYGVALTSGDSWWVLKEGESLPHYGRFDLRAAHGVLANSPQELNVFFLEGRSKVAEECMAVGHLAIRGTELSRSLNKGDTVEVRMKMDESRRITAKVFLPLHDLEFAVEMNCSLDAPDPADVRSQIERAASTLDQLKSVVTPDELDAVARLESDSERIEAELAKVETGEAGASERVGKRLSDLNADVNKLKNRYSVEMHYREAIGSLERAEAISTDFNDQFDIAACTEMRHDADKARRLDEVKSLEAIERKADDIFWRHYRKTQECWLGWTQWLRQRAHLAADPSTYMAYVQRVEQAAISDDLQAASINVRQAIDLLPEREVRAGRFDRAGLIRA